MDSRSKNSKRAAYSSESNPFGDNSGKISKARKKGRTASKEGKIAGNEENLVNSSSINLAMKISSSRPKNAPSNQVLIDTTNKVLSSTSNKQNPPPKMEIPPPTNIPNLQVKSDNNLEDILKAGHEVDIEYLVNCFCKSNQQATIHGFKILPINWAPQEFDRLKLWLTELGFSYEISRGRISRTYFIMAKSKVYGLHTALQNNNLLDKYIDGTGSYHDNTNSDRSESNSPAILPKSDSSDILSASCTPAVEPVRRRSSSSPMNRKRPFSANMTETLSSFRTSSHSAFLPLSNNNENIVRTRATSLRISTQGKAYRNQVISPVDSEPPTPMSACSDLSQDTSPEYKQNNRNIYNEVNFENDPENDNDNDGNTPVTVNTLTDLDHDDFSSTNDDEDMEISRSTPKRKCPHNSTYFRSLTDSASFLPITSPVLNLTPIPLSSHQNKSNNNQHFHQTYRLENEKQESRAESVTEKLSRLAIHSEEPDEDPQTNTVSHSDINQSAAVKETLSMTNLFATATISSTSTARSSTVPTVPAPASAPQLSSPAASVSSLVPSFPFLSLLNRIAPIPVDTNSNISSSSYATAITGTTNNATSATSGATKLSSHGDITAKSVTWSAAPTSASAMISSRLSVTVQGPPTKISDEKTSPVISSSMAKPSLISRFTDYMYSSDKSHSTTTASTTATATGATICLLPAKGKKNYYPNSYYRCVNHHFSAIPPSSLSCSSAAPLPAAHVDTPADLSPPLTDIRPLSFPFSSSFSSFNQTNATGNYSNKVFPLTESSTATAVATVTATATATIHEIVSTPVFDRNNSTINRIKSLRPITRTQSTPNVSVALSTPCPAHAAAKDDSHANAGSFCTPVSYPERDSCRDWLASEGANERILKGLVDKLDSNNRVIDLKLEEINFSSTLEPSVLGRCHSTGHIYENPFRASAWQPNLFEPPSTLDLRIAKPPSIFSSVEYNTTSSNYKDIPFDVQRKPRPHSTTPKPSSLFDHSEGKLPFVSLSTHTFSPEQHMITASRDRVLHPPPLRPSFSYTTQSSSNSSSNQTILPFQSILNTTTTSTTNNNSNNSRTTTTTNVLSTTSLAESMENDISDNDNNDEDDENNDNNMSILSECEIKEMKSKKRLAASLSRWRRRSSHSNHSDSPNSSSILSSSSTPNSVFKFNLKQKQRRRFSTLVSPLKFDSYGKFEKTPTHKKSDNCVVFPTIKENEKENQGKHNRSPNINNDKDKNKNQQLDLHLLNEKTFNCIIIGGIYLRKWRNNCPVISPSFNTSNRVVNLKINHKKCLELNVYQPKDDTIKKKNLGHSWIWLHAHPNGYLVANHPLQPQVYSICYYLSYHPLDAYWSSDSKDNSFTSYHSNSSQSSEHPLFFIQRNNNNNNSNNSHQLSNISGDESPMTSPNLINGQHTDKMNISTSSFHHPQSAFVSTSDEKLSINISAIKEGFGGWGVSPLSDSFSKIREIQDDSQENDDEDMNIEINDTDTLLDEDDDEENNNNHHIHHNPNHHHNQEDHDIDLEEEDGYKNDISMISQTEEDYHLKSPGISLDKFNLRSNSSEEGRSPFEALFKTSINLNHYPGLINSILKFLINFQPPNKKSNSNDNNNENTTSTTMHVTNSNNNNYKTISKVWTVEYYKILAKQTSLQIHSYDNNNNNNIDSNNNQWQLLVSQYSPNITYLNEGSCKQVYKIIHNTSAQTFALSMMDIPDLVEREMILAVQQEIEISLICSSLATLQICPNFLYINSIFQSKFPILPSKQKTATTTNMQTYEKDVAPSSYYQYIKQEYCTGGDLEDFLHKKTTSLSHKDIQSLIFQMCFVLYAGRHQLQLRHYDIKLLNFFITHGEALLSLNTTSVNTNKNSSMSDNTTDDNSRILVQYGLHEVLFELPMREQELCLVKLADFGTSCIGVEELYDNITPQQFTTLENTPPEYLILGSGAAQDYSADTFCLGLSILHLLSETAPYEELLETVHCPYYLAEKLDYLWNTTDTNSPFYVITEVLDSLDDSQYNDNKTKVQFPGRSAILSDTLYRYLVLFGMSKDFTDKIMSDNNWTTSPVWKLIEDTFDFTTGTTSTTSNPTSQCNATATDYDSTKNKKRRNPAVKITTKEGCNSRWGEHCRDWSLRTGTHPVMQRIRSHLENFSNNEFSALELLEKMVHFHPAERSSLTALLTSPMFTSLRINSSSGTNATNTARNFDNKTSNKLFQYLYFYDNFENDENNNNNNNNFY